MYVMYSSKQIHIDLYLLQKSYNIEKILEGSWAIFLIIANIIKIVRVNDLLEYICKRMLEFHHNDLWKL